MDALTNQVIGCAIEVHKHLGPGLLESSYEQCLLYELAQAGLNPQAQVELPVAYKGIDLNAGYRLDILIPNQLILEIKSVARIEPVYSAQLMTYLKLTGVSRGLLINFNVPKLVDGVKRISL